MQQTGQCFCGEVRFEATVDPERIFSCHCSDCQHVSSAPFRVSAIVAPGDLKLLGGAPASYLKTTSESGRERWLFFCKTCGTHVYATAKEPASGPVSLRAACLENWRQLQPVAEVWCQSELPWLDRRADLKSFEKQPAR